MRVLIVLSIKPRTAEGITNSIENTKNEHTHTHTHVSMNTPRCDNTNGATNCWNSEAGWVWVAPPRQTRSWKTAYEPANVCVAPLMSQRSKCNLHKKGLTQQMIKPTTGLMSKRHIRMCLHVRCMSHTATMHRERPSGTWHRENGSISGVWQREKTCQIKIVCLRYPRDVPHFSK